VIDLLISDIAAYPKVFFLQGALLEASIPAKICGMQPPDDLVAFLPKPHFAGTTITGDRVANVRIASCLSTTRPRSHSRNQLRA
jgi:hypothetical protein